MKMQTKTKEQLTNELEKMRQRVAELEKVDAERKRAEEELRESEEKYRTVLETIEEAYYEVDLAGNFTFFNDSLCRIIGYPRDELMGMNNRQYLDDETAKAVYEVFNGVYRTGEPDRAFGWEAIRKDGTRIFVESSISLMRGSSGEPVGFRGIIRDITERKQAEEALKASEEKLRVIFESITDGIIVSDLEGQIIDENEAAVRLQGYSDKVEVIGRDGFEFIAEKDRARATEDAMRSIEMGYGPAHEYTFVDKDGREYDAEASASLLRDSAGNTTGFISVFRDITERKQAEQELKASEEKLRAMFESITDGIVVTDLKGIILDVNDVVVQMSGLSREEIIGKDGFALIPREDRDKVVEGGKKIVRGETGPVRMEHEISPQVGSSQNTNLVLGTMHDSDGKPSGFVAIAQDFTERKKAEIALRESEAKYRDLVESISDVIYSVDANGATTYISPVVESVLGYTPSELTGSSFADFMYQEDLKSATEGFMNTLSGNTQIGEFRVVTKSGEVRWVRSSNHPVFEEDRVIGVTGVITDITERKKAEEALQVSEKRFQDIALSSGDWIWEVDANGKYVFTSGRVKEILGYSPEELIGKTPFELMPEEEAKHIGQIFQKTVAKKKVIVDLENWNLTKNGELVCLLTRGVPMLDNTGSLIGYRGIDKDITERKKAEEALRESEEKMRVTFESIGDAVAVIDLEGHFVQVNEAAARMSGYTREELVGRNVLETIIAKKDRDKIVLDMAQTLGEGDALGVRSYTLVDRDGREFESEFSTAVLRDSSGNIINFVGVARDVTERKRAEEERERLLHELERSNAELQQFAHVASHDLQEPLRMVASYTQLLEKRYKDKLDADAGEFIAYAVDGAKRMQNLIQGLLSYSRVGSRAKPLQPTECESVFEQALANLKLTIDESGAEVTHDPLPRVMADETQLIQLFQNLLANAIKFRDEKQPRIHVSAKEDTNECLFSVSDNGIGISPEYFDRIFVIFQRLHGREEYPGTGIGLSVCKRIVERHGGRIWVESQPGEGSTFCFTIPKGGEEQ